MEKKDCLLAVFENCEPSRPLKEILTQARIKARKLIIITKCGNTGEYLRLVRQIASDNMDLPVRHYHQVEPPDAAALEGCTTYEVFNP